MFTAAKNKLQEMKVKFRKKPAINQVPSESKIENTRTEIIVTTAYLYCPPKRKTSLTPTEYTCRILDIIVPGGHVTLDEAVTPEKKVDKQYPNLPEGYLPIDQLVTPNTPKNNTPKLPPGYVLLKDAVTPVSPGESRDCMFGAPTSLLDEFNNVADKKDCIKPVIVHTS